MRNLLIFFILLICKLSAFAQNDFNGYYYAPPTALLPQCEPGFNGSIVVGLGRGGVFNALEYQGMVGYKGVLAFGTYFDAKNNPIKQFEEVGTSSTNWETGLGVYKGGMKVCPSLLVGFGQSEVYSHYGFGKISNFNIDKWFFQPGIHYQDEFFTCGGGIKFNRVQFIAGEVDLTVSEFDVNIIKEIERQSIFLLPEINFQAGMQISMFVIGINVATLFPKSAGTNFAKFNSNISLKMNLGKLKKKEKVS